MLIIILSVWRLHRTLLSATAPSYTQYSPDEDIVKVLSFDMSVVPFSFIKFKVQSLTFDPTYFYQCNSICLLSDMSGKSAFTELQSKA